METTTLYEYKISKNKFIKKSHPAEVELDKEKNVFYIIHIGNPKRKMRFYSDSLDIVKSNHLFSLSDNFEENKEKLIKHYEEQIEAEKEKIRSYRNIINQIKNSKT